MFLDFSDGALAVPRQSDICIVGSGVMGLAIASHLMAHSSRQVLLVEEGGLEDTEAASAVPAEFSGGDLPSGVAGSRARGFGGSSRRWGGQALPFTPVDLEDRPFLTYRSGWPISWEELSRSYEAVDHFLGLSAIPFNSDLWQNQSVTGPFSDRDELELCISKYSPHAYLASKHRRAIQRSTQVDCLLHAKVATVDTITEPMRALGLSIRGPQGRQATISARVIVLCAGGIENARILLASQRQSGPSLGPAAKVVGSYYQDHLGFFAARMEPIDWNAFHHLFASFLPGNQKYLPKLQLAQALQRRLEVLNVTGNIEVQEAEDSPRNCARRIYNRLRGHRPVGGSLRTTVSDLRRLIAFTPASVNLLKTHLLDRRIGLPRDARFFLMANAETEPMPESRITLTGQLDDYGLQRPQVSWLVNDKTLKALQVYGKALKNILETARIATVQLSPYLTDPTANWRERAYSLYHHMGATRMASNPREGVVDSWGRVHGFTNLFVAGTSVLPSGSASNPSYTALALAFRTADQLLRDP